MAKKNENRVLVSLMCEECKNINYTEEKNKKNTCTIRQYMVCLTRRAEESRNEGDRSDFQKLQAAVPRVFVHSGCADNKDFPVSDLRPINVLACKTHF